MRGSEERVEVMSSGSDESRGCLKRARGWRKSWRCRGGRAAEVVEGWREAGYVEEGRWEKRRRKGRRCGGGRVGEVEEER